MYKIFTIYLQKFHFFISYVKIDTTGKASGENMKIISVLILMLLSPVTQAQQATSLSIEALAEQLRSTDFSELVCDLERFVSNGELIKRQQPKAFQSLKIQNVNGVPRTLVKFQGEALRVISQAAVHEGAVSNSQKVSAKSVFHLSHLPATGPFLGNPHFFIQGIELSFDVFISVPNSMGQPSHKNIGALAYIVDQNLKLISFYLVVNFPVQRIVTFRDCHGGVEGRVTAP
jgi:hypothetical protein